MINSHKYKIVGNFTKLNVGISTLALRFDITNCEIHGNMNNNDLYYSQHQIFTTAQPFSKTFCSLCRIRHGP